MSTRTDIQSEVGLHVFERAGLGKAPYRFTGTSENAISYPDGSSQAGGCCDYCATGIRYEFWLQSSDGKQFKVGCDCINKSGDSGLIKAYKNSPEYRKRQADMRHAREDSVIAQFQTRFPDYASRFAHLPHPNQYFADQGKTKADYWTFCWQMNGRTGKAQIARRILKNETATNQ